MRPLHVVEQGIHEHEEPCGAGREGGREGGGNRHSKGNGRRRVGGRIVHSPGGEDRAPPPAVVLSGELEVCEGH